MTANPNKELLEGMQCPNTNCGSYGPFVIRVETTVMVSDIDAKEIYEGHEWSRENYCRCPQCDHTGKVSDFSTAQQPMQVSIGNYSVCMDVNEDGDLQIRAYPVDRDGVAWDDPIDTLDVLKEDVLKAGET